MFIYIYCKFVRIIYSILFSLFYCYRGYWWIRVPKYGNRWITVTDIPRLRENKLADDWLSTRYDWYPRAHHTQNWVPWIQHIGSHQVNRLWSCPIAIRWQFIWNGYDHIDISQIFLGSQNLKQDIFLGGIRKGKKS